MIRSMLYATDLGLYAPYVMQHALALARTFKADLYVIHAVEPMGLFAESVLQSYLDEKALSEWQSQGLTTVMATYRATGVGQFSRGVGGRGARPEADSLGTGDPGGPVRGDSRPGAVNFLWIC